MIDVKKIRANPDYLRETIRLRCVDPERANVDRWLKLDEERRQLQAQIDDINGQKKQLAKLGKTDPEAARKRGQELREQGRELENKIGVVGAEWQGILDWFPNNPHPDMPEGIDESDNPEEKVWIPGSGYLPQEQLGKGDHSVVSMPTEVLHAGQQFKLQQHADLGPKLGMETFQASQVSGSRFAYIRGGAALMQFGLQQLLAGELLRRGYELLVPPLLVRERSLYGTSHFPEGRDQVYAIHTENVEDGAELFLVGSSEPVNFSYFMDTMLSEGDLPIRMFAYTTCFRSEAGSWGKDVKGIKRVHQFDKIEMNSVCAPSQSEQMYEEFGEINEWLLQILELPYRSVEKCGGDAGYLASHRQRDFEVWLPGSREFMEVMTDTNTTDYQARRMNIRYKAKAGSPTYCHTVNDTGCAMGRMLISIVENYQQDDGSVKVPSALRDVVGKDFIIPN